MGYRRTHAIMVYDRRGFNTPQWLSFTMIEFPPIFVEEIVDKISQFKFEHGLFNVIALLPIKKLVDFHHLTGEVKENLEAMSGEFIVKIIDAFMVRLCSPGFSGLPRGKFHVS